MHSDQDHAAHVKRLLDLALATDDPGRVVDAANAALGHALALVDAAGGTIGRAPRDADGERALMVARSAARTRVVAPPGWEIAPVSHGPSRLGILAIGLEGPADDDTRAALELLPAMLAGQLRRAALVALQRDALIHALVGDPALTAQHARREARAVGIDLASAYWPAVLGSRAAALASGVLERIARAARNRAAGSLTTQRNDRLVLLFPYARGDGEPPGSDEATSWFRDAADDARGLAPSSRAQVIAGDRPVGLGDLSATVAELEALWRFGPRSCADRPLSSPGEYALDRLLYSAVEPTDAARFVEAELGALIRWDRENRKDLLGVLEAALDHQRHDEAARRCFMHRNTFRHRLNVAIDVLGADLGDPDVRLALHVALKLRRLIPAEPRGSLAEPAGRARPSHRSERRPRELTTRSRESR